MLRAADVILQLETLSPVELLKVLYWFGERDSESPELLAGIDEGVRSRREKGTTIFSQEDLLQNLRVWDRCQDPTRF